mmetsp:Transcript_65197/g.121542  ORF Transcript_65197/g.121542 Transcript_65197/m.121542 type:complete len:495 (-) Transcript_65197:65-1549(-)
MSKYDKLSFGDGNSKFFLQRTLSEHDRSMDHPWMQMIYAKSFSMKQYGAWLAKMYAVFSALEDAVKDLEMLRPVHGSDLPRAKALETDMAKILGEDWMDTAKSIADGSVATQSYLKSFEADSCEPAHTLAHHFLQYNAVLSGGAFLGEMVSQSLGLPHGAPGVAFYAFEGVVRGKEAARVQQYLRRFDALDLTEEQRGTMLDVMKRVYADTEAMMTEVYLLQPVRGKPYAEAQLQNAGPVASVPPEEMIELSLSELHSKTGAGDGPIMMSLLGEVLDISAGRELYGPGGGYSLLAGHDVTRCLSTMSLEPRDLDDLEFVPQSSEDEQTLKNWQEKLKQKYPVIGKLRGVKDTGALDKDGLRQRVPAAKAGASSSSAPVKQDTPSAADKGQERCPISGKVGVGCPMSMFMGSAQKSGQEAPQVPTEKKDSAFMAGKSLLASVNESKPAQEETLFFKLCPLHWDDNTMKLLVCIASVAWCSGIFIGWNLHKQLMGP